MLYPAELRARAGRNSRDRGTVLPQTSETRMPAAVLADIGRGALVAVVGRGAVIIGEAAGREAGPVIVQIADRVGQPGVVMIAIIAVVVAMMDPGFRETWGEGDRGQHGGGGEKLHIVHLDSPKIPLNSSRVGRSARDFSPISPGNMDETLTGAPFLALSACLRNSQHSEATLRRPGNFVAIASRKASGLLFSPCASRLSPCCCYPPWPRRQHGPICILPAITAAMSRNTRPSTSASATSASASSSTASAIRPARWCSASCR